MGGLPEDIHKILTEADATATREAGKQPGEMYMASTEKVKAMSMKVVSFSDYDTAEFSKIFE